MVLDHFNLRQAATVGWSMGGETDASEPTGKNGSTSGWSYDT
ncbi:hypothetical protein ACWCQ0_25760 [Streptomyces massasporeus]|uniref:Uncharacterized protein n=1 Tax=Streptomyces massasporeus TaxID=67324 RepID=A0ABW6LW37_9ACTN